MNSRENQLLQAKVLVERLARLSADSVWARHASGMRASLDKSVEGIEAGRPVDMQQFDHLIRPGFEILEKAAEEIPVPEDPVQSPQKFINTFLCGVVKHYSINILPPF